MEFSLSPSKIIHWPVLNRICAPIIMLTRVDLKWERNILVLLRNSNWTSRSYYYDDSNLDWIQMDMPDIRTLEPPLSGCCAYDYYYYLSCTHIYSPTKCWLLLLLRRWITASDGNNFRKSSPRLQMITVLIYLLSWDQHWTHPSLTTSQAFRRQPASSARLDVLDNNARIVLSRNRNNII